MITVTQATLDALQKSIAVQAVPRVVIEWNQNRYTKVATVDNWGSSNEDSNAYDPDVFPIESIVRPMRPTSGILRAKTSEGVVTTGLVDPTLTQTVSGRGTGRAFRGRTYTTTPDDIYQYWTSQDKSGTTANAGGGYTINSAYASPYVIYNKAVWTNKIYLCFETSWAKPVVYNIDVTTDGTNWTTVATNVVPNLNGQVTLYRQADGTWSSTVSYFNPTQLLGVRIVVSSMSKTNSWLNLIEMGLRLENDLTPFLKSYSVGLEVADVDNIAPIGVASSNTGSVILDNTDGRFNNTAPSGTDPYPWYRGLIDLNAQVRIDLGFNTNGLWDGTTSEYIRQATMFTDDWTGNDTESTLDLKDGSKFLQELKPLPALIHNTTAGAIIWRLLDSVGWDNWEFSRAAFENANKIPFFWTDGTKTMWEIIQDVCRDTQTACYFDANGTLQIKTSQNAYNTAATPVWTFDYALNGTKQPDIMDLNVTGQYEANSVTIHYRPTALANDYRGLPIQEVVWKPDSDVVLRSSALVSDMDASQMYFYIPGKDAAYWPYDGMVNIRGELIKYKGKQYRYVDKNGNWQTKVCYSTDDKLHVDYDLSSSAKSYQNHFTGKMIVTKRGWDWTTGAAHDTTIQSWLNANPSFGPIGGTQTVWKGGLRHIRSDSLLRLNGRASWDENTFYCAPRTTPWNAAPTNFGTRFRFPRNPKGSKFRCGIFFSSNSALNSMYAVDIISTTQLSNGSARNEIAIIKRDSGTVTRLGANNGKGAAAAIVPGIWYDLDVTVSNGTISVFLNGRLVLNATDSSLVSTSRLGLYIRGNTIADFEYFYYATNAGWPDPDDDNSSFLDIIRGGYYSKQHYQDGYYRTRTAHRKAGNRSVSYKQKYSQRFFDEFGILVHEVRPYDVTFDKAPVTYSDLYFSNTYQAVALEYVGTPFGGHFILANASRYNAVVQGEDELPFGADNPVSQQLMVTGRTIQQQDEKTVVAKNNAAIRVRGEITLDFQSNWIQTEAHANDLANWIKDNWSTPADEIEVQAFGNPLLELTDVVSVNFPPKNMTAATHTYFVTRINHDFSEGGLSTTVTLRRLKAADF